MEHLRTPDGVESGGNGNRGSARLVYGNYIIALIHSCALPHPYLRVLQNGLRRVQHPNGGCGVPEFRTRLNLCVIRTVLGRLILLHKTFGQFTNGGSCVVCLWLPSSQDTCNRCWNSL